MAKLALHGGKLYGTTTNGGTYQRGVVFQLSPPAAGLTAWTESVIYTFGAPTRPIYPSQFASVAFDNSGRLYSTATEAGSGVVETYQLSPSTAKAPWTYQQIHVYDTSPAGDGGGPTTGVSIDKAGDLYGVTPSGGDDTNMPGGAGTVFRLTPPAARGGAWTKTTLYAFKGLNVEGSTPYWPPTLYTGGQLVVPTQFNAIEAGGDVYLLTPTSGTRPWKAKILADFSAIPPYARPNGSIAVDAAGNLYGSGSAFTGAGADVIFMVTPPPAGLTAWGVTNLSRDVIAPTDGVVLGSAGTMFGVSLTGGVIVPGSSQCATTGCGYVYELTLP